MLRDITIKKHNIMKNEKQFKELKKKHPDALLLFRIGDFYECYNEDAKDAAKILGITLTRSKDGTELTGFPSHALDRYLPILIRAGKRIAICDQLEEPKPTVKRSIAPKWSESVNEDINQTKTESKMEKEDFEKKCKELEKSYNERVNELKGEYEKKVKDVLKIAIIAYQNPETYDDDSFSKDCTEIVGFFDYIGIKISLGSRLEDREIKILYDYAKRNANKQNA